MRGRAGSLSLRREVTDLEALLDSALTPLRPAAVHHGLELRLAVLGDVPHAAIDRDKIAWVVVTLAGNALRYVERGDGSDSGGSVLVHLQHDAASDEISISPMLPARLERDGSRHRRVRPKRFPG
jgi:signal transduction histidine kinase